MQIRLKNLILNALIGLIALAGTASAEIISVTVDRSQPFDEASGYQYVEATMNGEVIRDDGTQGNYSVPVVLIYPEENGNGIGVVDFPNTVAFPLGLPGADEWSVLQFTRITTESFLFETGYTYMSVLWDKVVTDIFGPTPPDDGSEFNHLAYGFIERSDDAFHIMRDAAALLRDPSSLTGTDGPAPVDTVLSSGFSQTGMLINTFLALGENANGAFDGNLIGKMGLTCLVFLDEWPYFKFAPCPDHPAADQSVSIMIAGETDVVAFGAAFARTDAENWRSYELAGVSHLPVPIFPGLHPDQNTANSQQVFRAAIENLALWAADGIPAPPSKHLEGTITMDGGFDPDLDADGNALGGLRLPHMSQVIDDKVAGAPLGTYTGMNFEDPVADPIEDGLKFLTMIAGLFLPFSEAELEERYPTPGAYVSRVARAAEHLMENGYILPQDKDAYVQAASAEVMSITVDRSHPFDEVNGYQYVEGTMDGVIWRDDESQGEYSVPVVLIYPEEDGNGIGVVDLPNSAPIHMMPGAGEEWILQHTRTTTENYLFETGYTYISIQWDKAVTETFGPTPPDDGSDFNHLAYGTIEQGDDAFHIMRDAAAFLRDPGGFEGDSGPAPVDTVLSFGYSQTAQLINTFLAGGENANGAFDGNLIGKMGLLCLTFHNEPPLFSEMAPCPDHPASDPSVSIMIPAETDVIALAGAFARLDARNWRTYELAGVSHLPAPMFPGFHPNQNHANSQQVFRAAMKNLGMWAAEGIPAPPSRYLDGTIAEDGSFIPEVDEDGNALGGLRLPHMEQFIDGNLAGAPLGTYIGINPVEDLFVMIAGLFLPFSEAELAERYPHRGIYISRVARAAEYLESNGYILPHDKDDYVQAAVQKNFQPQPSHGQQNRHGANAP